MTDRPALLRIELAVSLLGLTVVAAAAPVTVDGFRFHLGHLFAASAISADCVVAVSTALISSVVVLRFLWTLCRQDLRRRRCLERLDVVPMGTSVAVYESNAVEAFTAGLWRPRIYLSRGVLRSLGPEAVAAILEHEASHVRRRDPLRVAIAQAASTALRWIPGVAPLAMRQETIGELAADAYAVRRLGQAHGLAEAMLRWEQQGGDAGLLPQRVDQLTGELRCDGVSFQVVAAAAAVLAALTVVSLAMLAAPTHPAAFCTVAAVAIAPIVLLPATVAARRAGRLLDLS